MNKTNTSSTSINDQVIRIFRSFQSLFQIDCSKINCSFDLSYFFSKVAPKRYVI